jgi:hypothetical protein
VQEQILERYPDADLSVYVVWLPVLAQDSRFEVDELVVDPRATHYWDNDQVVSGALSRAFGSGGGLVWDAFFVFGPDATWDDDPPSPLGSGAPVVDGIGNLESTLGPYLR